MESIEDSMSANKTVIEKHRFFSAYSRSQVSFFPQTLVVANENFKHLRHLDPQNSLWRSDTGFVQPGVPGVRVVFNDQLVVDAFQKTKDRTIEVDLLVEVLTGLNMLLPDPLLNDITAVRLKVVDKCRLVSPAVYVRQPPEGRSANNPIFSISQILEERQGFGLG
jgi:hypothetical protein